jgi:hypothetical protein
MNYEEKKIVIGRVARVLNVDEKRIWSQNMIDTVVSLVDHAEKQETLLGMWVKDEIK